MSQENLTQVTENITRVTLTTTTDKPTAKTPTNFLGSATQTTTNVAQSTTTTDVKPGAVTKPTTPAPTASVIQQMPEVSSPQPDAIDAAQTRNDNIIGLQGGSNAAKELNRNAVATGSSANFIRTKAIMIDANQGKVFVESALTKDQVDKLTIKNPSTGELEFKGNAYTFNNLPNGSVGYNASKPENQPAISLNPDGSASVKVTYDIKNINSIAGFLELKSTNVRNGSVDPSNTEAKKVAPAYSGAVTTTGALRIDFGAGEPTKFTGSLTISDTNGNSNAISGGLTVTGKNYTVPDNAIKAFGFATVAKTSEINNTSLSPNNNSEIKSIAPQAPQVKPTF
jgi:hypothetical protein